MTQEKADMAAGATPDATHADNDRHYLKAVAEVGDTRKLAVARSIYAANGIKLMDAGATLSSRTLERLVGHKLATPIENNLAAEGTLRIGEIVGRARELVDQHALLAQFATTGGSPERLWSRLVQAPLPDSILFRLTVAREKFARLYDHSLRAAFVALFIGSAARLAERDLELLATAALMHDLGMLHADPACFEDDRPLDAAARRQLRAHPVTGMLIAQREPRLNPAIATAILQHHERLDGSGYPTALAADEITRLARILMLVEIVLAMVEHRPHLPELQLSLILRANHRGFDRALAGILLSALPRVQVEADAAASGADTVARLGQLLEQWEHVKVVKATGLPLEVRQFVNQRLSRLHRFLTEAGIDPQAGAAQAWSDDPTANAELAGLMSEALWNVRQIAFETTLRWPQVAGDSVKNTDPALQAWLRTASEPFGAAGTEPAGAASLAA
jgi:HD-GYP domain-containing protein (c-di-GMP phosphodiesterase class II)